MNRKKHYCNDYARTLTNACVPIIEKNILNIHRFKRKVIIKLI